MTLVDCYGNDPVDSDEEMPPASNSAVRNSDNPFDRTISHGGEILNATGNQITFSAGEIPAVDSSEATNIWREMENLEYCDHTIFADMTPMMSDMFDKSDDCTVSDAVRAMAAMGECNIPHRWMYLRIRDSGLDDSDKESDGDDGSLAGEFDEDWAPHGSKSVGWRVSHKS